MAFKKWTENPFVIAIAMLGSIAAIVATIVALKNDTSEKGYNNFAVSPSPTLPTVSPKTLDIHVIDDDNKQSLEDVKVTLFPNGSPELSVTDGNGYTYFPISLNNSKVKLSLKKEGYQDKMFIVDVTTYADRPKEFSLKKKY
jgi:hypothetical protein